MSILELRNIQLSMLDYIDGVCRHNNLQYFLFAGTILGAVRHKGYIPWDQDLDIALPRNDYEKLIEIIHKENNDSFLIGSHKTLKKHSAPHAILYAKNKKVLIKHPVSNHEIYHGGLNLVFIDIFPLDSGPNDLKLQKKHEKNIKFYKTLLYHKKGQIYKKGFFYLFAKRIVSLILFPLSYRYILTKLEKEMMRFNNQVNCDFVIDGATSYTYFRTLLPKEVYSSSVKLEFEGKSYPVPVGYVQYLTKYYGNYMKTPPQKVIDELMSTFPILLG